MDLELQGKTALITAQEIAYIVLFLAPLPSP